MPIGNSQRSQEHPPLSEVTAHPKVPGSAVVSGGHPMRHPSVGQTMHCHGRHLQKHFSNLHPALIPALPTQYHSQPGNQILPGIHSGMSLGDWPVPAPTSLQLVCKCCLLWQLLCKVPETACLTLFPSCPSPKPPGPSPVCFTFLNRQWCRPRQHTAPWGKQEWTEVTFFCTQNIPSMPPAPASGCLSPSTGLCALLWGTADQHGEEQSWVFTQQSWPALRERAAEACSGRSGLPRIASTLREERMPLTQTSFLLSFSSCHHLPTSCSCHLPLAIRQLHSAQSDFWFSPFKLCFYK